MPQVRVKLDLRQLRRRLISFGYQEVISIVLWSLSWKKSFPWLNAANKSYPTLFPVKCRLCAETSGRVCCKHLSIIKTASRQSAYFLNQV